MKFIFICLLILNAVLFLVWQGYAEYPMEKSRQPQRLLKQQNSQYLKIISPEVATSSVAVFATDKPPKEDIFSCLKWGEFQTNEFKKVNAQLASLTLGNRQSRQPVQQSTSTIVYIASLGSKEAADKKVEELKQLGIQDFYIIQDQSPLRWGISLGIFKSEEAAKQLLATLVSKGVRSAKMKARTEVKAAAAHKFDYVFKDLTSAEKSKLEKLSAEFPQQRLRACK